MKEYMIVTQIFTDKGIERWYYGTYDRFNANEIALEMNERRGSNYPIGNIVIETAVAKDWGVLNLPF